MVKQKITHAANKSPQNKGTTMHAKSMASSLGHNLSATNEGDEIITSLLDAYENKRARQVSEWEQKQSRFAPVMFL